MITEKERKGNPGNLDASQNSYHLNRDKCIPYLKCQLFLIGDEAEHTVANPEKSPTRPPALFWSSYF